MSIAGYFNLTRLGHLLKRDFNSKWKEYLITMGAALGVFLLIMIITSKFGTIAYELHYTFVSILLFVIAIIFTSTAFKDAHKKLLNHDWLMLPASTIEKLCGKLLLHLVIIPITAIFIYWAFNLIGLLVIRLFFGEYYPIFNIADTAIWQMYGHYVIASSIFVLGAAWFKNNNFIKTIVALIVFSTIMSLLSTLIVWIVFNDYFWPLVRGDFNFYYNFEGGFDMEALEAYGTGLFYLIKVFYFVLLAPVCWFGAWLKLREIEVKDGI